MQHLSDAFKKRQWVAKKIQPKKPQADLTELPLFGQERLKREEQQRKAQGELPLITMETEEGERTWRKNSESSEQ